MVSSMPEIKFICENLEKRFTDKLIFKNLSFSLKEKSSLAVTGRNGSGKSTLLKILCNLIKENKGKLSLEINSKHIERENYYKFIGLVSPYINLYDELTAFENLEFFASLKNISGNTGNRKEKIYSLLEKVNLYSVRNELVKNYSSGMKQRLKIAFSILNNPLILFLDEPKTNLDNEGINIIYKIANEQKEKGILILATNDEEDTNLCDVRINIEDYK